MLPCRFDASQECQTVARFVHMVMRPGRLAAPRRLWTRLDYRTELFTAVYCGRGVVAVSIDTAHAPAVRINRRMTAGATGASVPEPRLETIEFVLNGPGVGTDDDHLSLDSDGQVPSRWLEMINDFAFRGAGRFSSCFIKAGHLDSLARAWAAVLCDDTEQALQMRRDIYLHNVRRPCALVIATASGWGTPKPGPWLPLTEKLLAPRLPSASIYHPPKTYNGIDIRSSMLAEWARFVGMRPGLHQLFVRDLDGVACYQSQDGVPLEELVVIRELVRAGGLAAAVVPVASVKYLAGCGRQLPATILVVMLRRRRRPGTTIPPEILRLVMFS